jgi:hypothetical protein
MAAKMPGMAAGKTTHTGLGGLPQSPGSFLSLRGSEGHLRTLKMIDHRETGADRQRRRSAGIKINKSWSQEASTIRAKNPRTTDATG